MILMCGAIQLSEPLHTAVFLSDCSPESKLKMRLAAEYKIQVSECYPSGYGYDKLVRMGESECRTG